MKVIDTSEKILRTCAMKNWNWAINETEVYNVQSTCTIVHALKRFPIEAIIGQNSFNLILYVVVHINKGFLITFSPCM